MYQSHITAAIHSNPRTRLSYNAKNGGIIIKTTFNHDPSRQRIMNAPMTTGIGNNKMDRPYGAHTNITSHTARHGVPQHVGRGTVTWAITRQGGGRPTVEITVAQDKTLVLEEYAMMTAAATMITDSSTEVAGPFSPAGAIVVAASVGAAAGAIWQ